MKENITINSIDNKQYSIGIKYQYILLVKFNSIALLVSKDLQSFFKNRITFYTLTYNSKNRQSYSIILRINFYI